MRPISLGHNAVPDTAKKLVLEVLESGQFSPGPKVREFEEKFAALHKAKHAIFVNSGTDALRLSLLALKEKYGWSDGDLVAVPTVTFVATVNVILQAGLRPYFVDVSMHDYLINAEQLEHFVDCTPGGKIRELRAIMPVHLFGQSCDQKIFDLAKKLKLKVLEDSCETILNPVRGDASCHSTYMAHHLTTGVGGFALTNDFELNWLIRSYANHGRDPLYIPGSHGMIQAKGKELLRRRFSFDRIGYSCRGTEFEAALGLSQLPGLEGVVLHRRSVARKLLEALDEFPVRLPWPRNNNFTHHAYMMFPIILSEDSGIDKYDLCLHLEKSGIETRDMMPITNQPCYRSLKIGNFSVSDNLNKNGFYIPCHQDMTDLDVLNIKKVFYLYSKVLLDKKVVAPLV